MGLHRIAPLRAWLYELPKSGSSTLISLLKLKHGALSRSEPQPGDVGFAVVRHPTCRAVSAFHTAYDRAVLRTNSSKSACPFGSFPYLLAASSSDVGQRFSRAMSTVHQFGSKLAGPACGYAYHHLLSQSFFLQHSQKVAAQHGLEPPLPTIALRLEQLVPDLVRLCAARNATYFCDRLLRSHGGSLPHVNANKNRSEANVLLAPNSSGAGCLMRDDKLQQQVQDTYRSDFDCLGYLYAV